MAKKHPPQGPRPKYVKKMPEPPAVTAVSVTRAVPPAAAARKTRADRHDQGTPAQQRAAFALTRIQALADRWRTDAKTQKEFNSHASAMPFMIRANGLGQTAAFYRRKGTDHVYYQLYALLGDWLAEPGRPFAGTPDLLTAITQSDQDAYLAAQIEALLFLDWVKKLASAFLAREGDTSAPLAGGESDRGEGRKTQ